MDTAKLRLFAGAGGVLFGFTGLIALAVALIIVLAESIGAALAVTIVALVFVALGAIGLYLFLLPHRPAQEEVDKIENMGAEALSELPVDTIRAFVSNRPLAAIGLAGVLGYGLIQDPKSAGKQAQKLFLGLL